MEQTDSCHEGGMGGMNERRGRDEPMNMYAWPTDTGNSVVMARGKGGSRGWVDVGKRGENGDICNSFNEVFLKSFSIHAENDSIRHHETCIQEI